MNGFTLSSGFANRSFIMELSRSELRSDRAPLKALRKEPMSLGGKALV